MVKGLQRQSDRVISRDDLQKQSGRVISRDDLQKDIQIKGSITVFMTLTLVLVLSFLFSLLELARVSGIQSQTAMNADVSLTSMFGNYNAELWKNYHLLFLDGAWQKEDLSIRAFEGRMLAVMENNVKDTHSLYGFSPTNVEILAYSLATDEGGSVFRRQVIAQIQKEVAISAAESLLHVNDEEKQMQEESKGVENIWKEALDGETSAKEAKSKKTSEEQQAEKESEKAEANTEETVENPMEYVKGLKTSSLLSMVLPDASKLSAKGIPLSDSLPKRSRHVGTMEATKGGSITDRGWIQAYINAYFSYCGAQEDKGAKTKALDYEIEYLIGGRGSDRENLEAVVGELLLLREGANFLTLMKDTEKKTIALSIATAAVGFTGVPPLIKAVQMGILLAWAYVESIMDIRALLAGKKIPIIKTREEWSSDFTNCRKSVESKNGAKEDGRGLSYENYLQMLLLPVSETDLSYRCMDLMEKNLRLTEGNENLRMDCMIQHIKAGFQYEGKPLFWNLIFVKHDSLKTFFFRQEKELSYG
ncbi:hypothetical protein FACS1894111_08340 [Clostridia bacterium]|nr:hypothetical protein FACS1894111_08340 [Clostridia bacterium]